MTEAEMAKRRLLELVSEAQSEGSDILDLLEEPLEHLEFLPPEISNFKSLAHFRLGRTKVEDLSPLSSLTSLLEIYIRDSPIKDLSAVSNLPKLVVLIVENSELEDLEALRGESYFVLSINGSRVKNLLPLAEMASLDGLFFSDTQVKDLTPIAHMEKLGQLEMRRTPVQDLTPLASLTGLYELNIQNTLAEDLRPLRSIERLADDPLDSGLTFKSCEAANLDPNIAEISEIRDPAERAKSLFDYLENWSPSVEGAPRFDPLIPVDLIDEKLEIALSTPSQAELDDRVKRALHERLQARSAELAQLAGNEFFLLSAKARSFHERLEPDFEDVDLLNVHLDLAELSHLADRGFEREGDPEFPEHIADALEAIVQDGPGLTLDNPDVELLEARKSRFRTQSDSSRDTLESMAAALVADERSVGANLRALANRSIEEPDSPEVGIILRSVNRNVLIRIGRWAIVGAGTVAGAVAVDLAKAPILDFIAANWPIISETASVYGVSFQTWFEGTLGGLPNLPEVIRASISEMERNRRKQDKSGE